MQGPGYMQDCIATHFTALFSARHGSDHLACPAWALDMLRSLCRAMPSRVMASKRVHMQPPGNAGWFPAAFVEFTLPGGAEKALVSWALVFMPLFRAAGVFLARCVWWWGGT